MTEAAGHAESSWRKAEAHLREAMAQETDASPMAMVRSSYYAMFHAARAVLFRATGDAPHRHDRVIQQFGLLVRDRDGGLRAAGKAFNEIKDERTAADYDATMSPSADEARDAVAAADLFLAVCGAFFQFRS